MAKDLKEVYNEYAEVIGKVCLNWNLIEEWILMITVQYFNNDHQKVAAMSMGMSGQAKVSLLMWCAKNRESVSEYADLLIHLCEVSSVCEENRNILIHSSIGFDESKNPAFFEKRSKKNSASKVRYLYEIDTLRRIVQEFENVVVLAYALAVPHYTYMVEIKQAEISRLKGKPHEVPQRPKLPDRVAMPTKLVAVAPTGRT